MMNYEKLPTKRQVKQKVSVLLQVPNYRQFYPFLVYSKLTRNTLPVLINFMTSEQLFTWIRICIRLLMAFLRIIL